MNRYRARFGLWLIGVGLSLIPSGPSRDQLGKVIKSWRRHVVERL